MTRKIKHVHAEMDILEKTFHCKTQPEKIHKICFRFSDEKLFYLFRRAQPDQANSKTWKSWKTFLHVTARAKNLKREPNVSGFLLKQKK